VADAQLEQGDTLGKGQGADRREQRKSKEASLLNGAAEVPYGWGIQSLSAKTISLEPERLCRHYA
jgi:hypothetical protein